jgi:hypothetical protein
VERKRRDLTGNRLFWLVAACLGLAITSVSAPAAILDDIGFNRLKTEQGAALSTGNGVPVAQSEAVSGAAGGYYPSTTHADFSGKNFVEASGDLPVSNHATSVGRSFYGTALSVSPGVTSITNYTATGWLNNDFLRSQSTNLPRTSNARVANHSWISDGFGDEILNSLQRTDYLVEKDDFIQVAGINNRATGAADAPNSLFASAFNVLAVGISSGNHSAGATDISAPYLAVNRVRPHLVAPANQTSFAAPLVASTAALLTDLGRDRPGLSNDTQLSSAGRSNRTINNAETSEVIRAALMAGANRQAITDLNNGFTYNATSSSGLDPRFGAGQLDVYQSYHIALGGEQDAFERGNSDGIKLYGFDYEASFAANQTRTYRFSVDEVTRQFAASLAWNVDIDLEPVGLGGILVDPNVEVRDLNLTLRTLSGDTIASSSGLGDVTENLYVPILPKGDYEIVVSGANFIPSNPWSIEYGLAWRFAPSSTPLMGDVNLDGAVSLLDLAQIQRNFGLDQRAVWTDGDLNIDGRVDREDIALLAGAYGGGTLPIVVDVPGGVGQQVGSPVAVPEPSTAMLAACGGLATLLVSRRKRKRRAC